MEIKFVPDITKNITNNTAINTSVYMPVGIDGTISESNISKAKSMYIVVHMLSQVVEYLPQSLSSFSFFSSKAGKLKNYIS